jgi:superfamily II DNA or RNA helicase
MAQDKKQKKSLRRAAKAKERRARTESAPAWKREMAEDFIGLAYGHCDNCSWDAALDLAREALKHAPEDPRALRILAAAGYRTNARALANQALYTLFQQGVLIPQDWRPLVSNLLAEKEYAKACEVARSGLEALKGKRFQGGAQDRAYLGDALRICGLRLAASSQPPGPDSRASSAPSRPKTQAKTQAHAKEGDRRGPAAESKASAPGPAGERAAPPSRPAPSPFDVSVPLIRVTFEPDQAAFAEAFGAAAPAGRPAFDLAVEARRIRLGETFDTLVCLGGLTGVQSLWYQEETARKVLRRFRGRALLSDEVGLGKTIEALMVLKEYLARGMVRTALVLAPAPLVSQWSREMREKFGIQAPSTEDASFRAGDAAFWENPVVLASINQAKSRKNCDLVCARSWDMVIVDEAHHLKNRTTLNWTLVNALHKRFLLLLTATPVENNLMELYNLVTLLAPGTLKTASAFREEFMTRGDPTDPRNRGKLKGLLDQVMIRNTRAVARLNLPPRFATTVRVAPTSPEAALYERIDGLVRALGTASSRRMLRKSLLEQAGSSPPAVHAAITRMLDRGNVPDQGRIPVQAVQELCQGMGETAKNKALKEILDNNPGQVLVFAKFTATLEHLSGFLTRAGVDHAKFHGGLDSRQKDAQVADFLAGKRVLVATEIGGEGKNLQQCHQMVNYDLPWNPMKIEQRIGRIHRIGQENEVRIFNLCQAGTLEDHILNVLDKKINMFEMVIGEIDMVLGRIGTDDDFSDMVFDLWVSADTHDERVGAFTKLGAQLVRAKNRYLKTRELDEKLFGDQYEI